MAILSGLKPEKVFSYFEALCAVPHGSGNTKQISDLCIDFARALGLRCRQDALNNVVIWKDASPGYENAAPIILQGHIDMVCAKTADCNKDMATEGLDLVTDGVSVWADKTTLGADNAIAVAMILALLTDETLTHPPLEAVFTVDEEVGMDGAIALDCSDLKGRKMINLDSEEEGVFTVSCAGGIRADCLLTAAQQPLCGETGYTVVLEGLLGGHSGADIHRGRGNANTLLARALYTAEETLGGLRLAALHGGEFDNVICNHAEATVAVPADKATEFAAFMADFDAVLRNELAASDAGVSLHCTPAAVETAVSEKESRTLLYTLLALPQGVQEVSHDFEGLTQTSLNLGVMELLPDGLHFSHSIRSCIASQKEALLQKLTAIVTFAGGTVSTRGGYPGWQYRKESDFRDLVMEVYREQSGAAGRLEATHGGLECGLFIEKMPGLDVISLGPELHDVHSVHETLSVASTERVYALVREVLRRSK